MSSSNQRFSSGGLSEAIQKHHREKVAKKIRKRKENGWEEVHREMKSCELSEAIQKLPPELREKILKELIEIKVKEKKKMGWDEVHEDLENLPYCEKHGQLTKVFKCVKCGTCKITGLCVACYENGFEYHSLVGIEETNDLDAEKRFVKAWGQTKLISEINEDYKKSSNNIKVMDKEKEKLIWKEIMRTSLENMQNLRAQLENGHRK